MQLFDSAKTYVFLFCVLAIIAAEKLHQLTQRAAYVSTTDFNFKNLLLALTTVLLAAYLGRLLLKISNRIEQLGVVLTEVLCVLWLANLLAELGVAWAQIPHSRFLGTTLHCTVTVLAGVRAFQVMWHRRTTQDAG